MSLGGLDPCLASLSITNATVTLHNGQPMTTALTTTTAPIVTLKGNQAFANSRDVATFFGKPHDNVLRDIDVLLLGPSELSDLFHEHAEYHDKARKLVRAFDMTKDGFTLLAMGFTGAKALQFKLAHIAAFNEMDALLRTSPRSNAFGLNEQRLAERHSLPEPFSGSRAPSYTVISKSGLYKLIMRSDKPEACTFQDWVTRKVLPAIRKTGGYLHNEEA